MVDYRNKNKRTGQGALRTGRRGRQRSFLRGAQRATNRRLPEGMESRGERLQKVLANLGLGSRRKIDDLIAEGAVLVNNEPAVLGQRVYHGDRVVIEGRKVIVDLAPRAPRVIIYHKPEGEIVSKDDPEGRPSVFDHLPQLRHERWIPIGRLDFNTCGLLLLTTSGELADHFMHPRYEIEREYAVRIRGPLEDDQIQALKNGVMLEDGMASVESITGPFGHDEEKNHWYHIVLKEGRNREVRRLFSAIDANLTRLMRVRFGTVQLPPDLRRGCTKELTNQEIKALIKENFPDEANWLSRGESSPKSVSYSEQEGKVEDSRPFGTFDERPAPRFSRNSNDSTRKFSDNRSEQGYRGHSASEEMPRRNHSRPVNSYQRSDRRAHSGRPFSSPHSPNEAREGQRGAYRGPNYGSDRQKNGYRHDANGYRSDPSRESGNRGGYGQRGGNFQGSPSFRRGPMNNGYQGNDGNRQAPPYANKRTPYAFHAAEGRSSGVPGQRNGHRGAPSRGYEQSRWKPQSTEGGYREMSHHSFGQQKQWGDRRSQGLHQGGGVNGNRQGYHNPQGHPGGSQDAYRGNRQPDFRANHRGPYQGTPAQGGPNGYHDRSERRSRSVYDRSRRTRYPGDNPTGFAGGAPRSEEEKKS